MITAVEVIERDERNEITFPPPNGLPAKTRSDFDWVSPSGDKKVVGERGQEKWKREPPEEGEKREQLSVGPASNRKETPRRGAGVVHD